MNHTAETKAKLSKNARRPMLGVTGKDHPCWKDVKVTQAEADKRWRENNKERWNLLCRIAQQRRRAVGKINAELWQQKVNEMGNMCQHCERTADEVKLTIDHIIPVVKGGTNDIDNLQPLCRSCNSKKGVTVADALI